MSNTRTHRNPWRELAKLQRVDYAQLDAYIARQVADDDKRKMPRARRALPQKTDKIMLLTSADVALSLERFRVVAELMPEEAAVVAAILKNLLDHYRADHPGVI